MRKSPKASGKSFRLAFFLNAISCIGLADLPTQVREGPKDILTLYLLT